MVTVWIITLVLLLGLQLFIIVCIAWTHGPFTFRDFWQDAWKKRKKH